MNETVKPQPNVSGGSRAAGRVPSQMPRRKPGAPSQAANYPGRKPGAPGATSPKREEPSRVIRDDEDTLTGIESDEEE